MRKPKKQFGMMFIVAVVALSVMVMIGTSFVASSVQSLNDAKRDLDSYQSLAAAEAGIHYFVWQQRYSDTPFTGQPHVIADTPGMRRALSPTGGAFAPQIPLTNTPMGKGQYAVWFINNTANGATATSYEVISKGYYGGRERTIRALLQGPVTAAPTPPPPPGGGNQEIVPSGWGNFAIFADAQAEINTSCDVSGRTTAPAADTEGVVPYYGAVASNGSVVVNTSGGGSIVGNVFSAGTVQYQKNYTLPAKLFFGTDVLDKKGQKITNSVLANPTNYASGGVTKITNPVKIPVEVMDPAKYDAIAGLYDHNPYDAYYAHGSLGSNANLAPVLVINKAHVPNYELDISGNLMGTRTIFVNGNIVIKGNAQLGDPDNPVALIATGNINLSGTPTIYGFVWAKGAVGFGHNKIYGSVRCSTATFQGNPQIRWRGYATDVINPPPPPTPPDDGDGEQQAGAPQQWIINAWQVL